MAPRRIKWTPRDLIILISLGSACLCLILLILGVVIGVLTKAISPDVLGEIQGISVGGGLLGFALIIYWIIRDTLSKLSLSEGERDGGDDRQR
jgi:hypothetical protein